MFLCISFEKFVSLCSRVDSVWVVLLFVVMWFVMWWVDFFRLVSVD